MKPPLKIFLATRLAAQVGARIARGDIRIGLRIPVFIIRAVEDADKVSASRIEIRRKPHAPIGRQDLRAVRRGNRRKHIRKRHTRLQKIDTAKIFKFVRREMLIPDPYVGKCARVILALVPDIMDGQHARRIRQRRENPIPRLEENGHQRRRPIMRVHHIRNEADILAYLQRGLGEQRKTECVVGILA